MGGRSQIEKKCIDCNRVLPLGEYYTRKGSLDGHRNQCKSCFSERKKFNYAMNRETILEKQKEYAFRAKDMIKARNRKVYLWKKYGLTQDAYDAMAAEQNGICYLCGNECRVQDCLSVDHCHTTGRVRKLLCHFCNSAIGFLNHDPGLLRRAAIYLEEHSGTHQTYFG